MRWHRRVAVNPSIGDTRDRSRYLLIPKTIGSETRWLTSATWREQYCRVSGSWLCGDDDYDWVPVKWWPDAV